MKATATIMVRLKPDRAGEDLLEHFHIHVAI
jgi:hypothetical protein